MNEKCRTCEQDIHKTPGGHWIHTSLEAQIKGKYQIHTPQPLVRMVEEEGLHFKDI